MTWAECEVDTNALCLDGHTIDSDDNICVGAFTWKVREVEVVEEEAAEEEVVEEETAEEETA